MPCSDGASGPVADHDSAVPAKPSYAAQFHRSVSSDDRRLVVDAVAEVASLPGRVDVFVHGEAGEVRAVRRHLVGERGIDRSGTSISPYRRRGDTDEAWRAHKRELVAAMRADV